MKRAERTGKTRAKTCGEIADLYLVVIASAAKQSIVQQERKLIASLRSQ